MPVTTKKNRMTREMQMTAEIPRSAGEISQSAAVIARQSVDQAQAAFEKARDMAHDQVQIFDATAGALKASCAELQLKAIEIAQANTNAAFAHLRKLLSVTQPTEILPLTQSYMGEQTQALVRHAAEFNDMAVKLAAETVKPLQEGFLKSFDGVKKAFNA